MIRELETVQGKPVELLLTHTVVDGNQTNTTLPQNLHNLTDLQIVAS